MLARQGYVIWRRNERVRRDELDIVAIHGRQLILVEVRSRRMQSRLGDAFSEHDLISRKKERRLQRAAAAFVRRHRPDMLRRRITGVRLDYCTVIYTKHRFKSPAISYFEAWVPFQSPEANERALSPVHIQYRSYW